MDQAVANSTYHNVKRFSHYFAIAMYDPQLKTSIPLTRSQDDDDLLPSCVMLEQHASGEKVPHELHGLDVDGPQ